MTLLSKTRRYALPLIACLTILPSSPTFAAEEVYYDEMCINRAANQADRFEEEGAQSGQNWNQLFIYFLSSCTPLNTPGRGRPGSGGVSGYEFCSSRAPCDVVYYSGRIPYADDK